MKLVKILRSAFAILSGSLLILIGILCLILSEPIYGIAFVLLGLFVFPFFWRQLGRRIKFQPSRSLKLGIWVGLLGLVFTSLALQGRSTYDQQEEITQSGLDSLSIHPVKKQVINGLDYYYIEAGRGEAIFLLHGFPDMANTWDETITELSKDYRVIAPFLRGYYPTGIPENGDYAVKTIAGDIVALSNSLGIEQFNIVGQDWGASISYSVANLAPEKVKRVGAIAIPHPTCFKLSPGLIWAGRHFILFSTGDYGVRYTRKQDFKYIDRLYRRWSPDYIDYKESSSAIKETFKYPGRLEAALGYYWSFQREQGNEERSQFYSTLPKAPVLYLGGEHDKGVTEHSLKSMEETMPDGSKSVLFKNAGHFLHRELPEAFIQELRVFLSSES